MRTRLDKRPREVSAMFDAVAEGYERTNIVLSLGQCYRWRRLVAQAAGVRPGQRVLDVAAGTGFSSVAFAGCGAEVVAADFSPGMVRVGRRRRPGVDFVVADASDLPFPSGSFDVTTISFGLRNVHEPGAVLEQMRRVTKRGGRVVIAEFSHPSHPLLRGSYFWYLSVVMPVVARWVSSDASAYEYLGESIRAWPNQERLAAQLRAAGWSQVQYRNVLGGVVALHRGRNW